MKVHFSSIPEGDEQGDELFTDAEGVSYYFSISDSDTCEEEFVVTDSCGRFVPFPLEDLDALINALEVYRVHMIDGLFNPADAVAILD